MFKQSLAIVSCIVITVLPMCVTAYAAAPDEYFPLTVGNRWVYESSEGTKEAPALESWEVVRREGAGFVVRIQQPFVTTDGLEELFEVGAEGLRRRELDSEASASPLVLKLPPVVGLSWQSSDGRYAITSVGESVTVPAGTFSNCVEVTRWRKETNVKVVATYAPGVGMIQREETFPIIGGFGSGADFDSLARGRTILRLREWKLQGQESSTNDR